MQITSATSSDINAVLAQMRALRDRAQISAPAGLVEQDSTGTVKNADFGGALKNAIDNVNRLQQTSSATSNDFLLGKENDLVKVMVDSQKANLGFQAMVQVRNRMISAYQDIMNMPI